MDDSTMPVVLETLRRERERLLGWVSRTEELERGTAEQTIRDRVLALGGQLLTAGLAARGPGKVGPRVPCPRGEAATFEGYRRKGVQTLVGWIERRRVSAACPACGQGHCPLDAALGVARESHRPEVRSLASQFGARRPFAPAAAILRAAARVQLSPSTVRVVTEAGGAAGGGGGLGERAARRHHRAPGSPVCGPGMGCAS